MPELHIRPATRDDCALIGTLLRELAGYENLLAGFLTTEAQIARDFFGPDAAVHCDLAFDGDAPVGIVTWYWTYRSFKAERGLFIEDLFVRADRRGKGHGRALLGYLAAKVLDAGAARLEWLVLDWNIASIEFYKSLGGRQAEEWLTYRLDGEALKELGAS